MVSVNIFVGNKLFLLYQYKIFIINQLLVNSNRIYQTTKIVIDETVEKTLLIIIKPS